MGKKIVLFIYASPFHFQPTTNAANLLLEQGHEVHLIGVKQEDNWIQQLHPGVKLVYIHDQTTGIRSVFQFIKSILFLSKYVTKHRINWMISYDAKSVLPAFVAAGFNINTKWIYHQHDFWEFTRSAWEKLLWYSERRLVRYADVVSFPQTERASFFQKAAKLKEYPLIVHNGPRKKWLEEALTPHAVVKAFREKYDYILIYQGSWSKYFGLERIFDALAICHSNTALIMLGEEREKGIRDSYIRYIEKLDIRDKVYLAEKYIPYEQLPSFTKFADAAIGKLTGEEDNAPFNDKYLIGAANKITEYIACGLPVILQDSGSSRTFLERFRIGVLTETKKKEAFAKTIDELLEQPVTRLQISENNRYLFQEELNFDSQFKKILDKINLNGRN